MVHFDFVVSKEDADIIFNATDEIIIGCEEKKKGYPQKAVGHIALLDKHINYLNKLKSVMTHNLVSP
jgi:hypothetical protein